MTRTKGRSAVALALVGALALTGCSGGTGTAGDTAGTAGEPSTVAPAAPTVTTVDAAEALEVIAEQEVSLLDVRTPEEFAAGHLPGAVNIDLSSPDFSILAGQLPTDATYVVYCRSGNRSAAATAVLAELGFTSLYDVSGGIQDWVAAGGPVVS